MLNKIIDFYPDKLSLENTVSLYLRLECFNLDFLQLILSTDDIDSIDWQLFEEDFINFNKILELYQKYPNNQMAFQQLHNLVPKIKYFLYYIYQYHLN